MKKNLMLLLICIVSISCLDPITFEDEIIFIIKGDSQLNIINRGDNTVYYFIVEQNTAAYINWAPGVNGPYILSGKTVTVKYSEIFNLENLAINNETKVIFYYWIRPVNSIYDVKGLLIDL